MAFVLKVLAATSSSKLNFTCRVTALLFIAFSDIFVCSGVPVSMVVVGVPVFQ